MVQRNHTSLFTVNNSIPCTRFFIIGNDFQAKRIVLTLSEREINVRILFQKWTAAAAEMATGQMIGDLNEQHNAPPLDTEEAEGLSASKVTITFGVGPSFFDGRFGLAGKRPAELQDLPSYSGDQLSEDWCGGDIGIQVCANDLQVAFHAIRNLARIARGIAVLYGLRKGSSVRQGPIPRGRRRVICLASRMAPAILM